VKRFNSNMLVQFSVLSFVVLMLIALSLGFFISGKIESFSLGEALHHVETDAEVFINDYLLPSDFENPMEGERYEEFDRLIQRFLISDMIAEAELWNPNGVLIYSSVPIDAEGLLKHESDFKSVMAGIPIVEVEKGKSEPLNVHQSQDMVEIYLPVQLPGESEVAGALEIYQNHENTLAHINQMKQWVFLATGSGLLVLYISLVSIVWRGSKTINQQQVSLKEINSTLEIERKSLEIRVKERTSDLLKASENLVISEQNFRNSLKDSPLPIIVSKSVNKQIYANQGALDLFGYNNIEEMQKAALSRSHKAETMNEIKDRWDRINEGVFTPEYAEETVIRTDGQIRYVEAHHKMVSWGGAQVLQVAFIDITERKQIEGQLRHSQVLASLGEMTAGISHEIGNPLASIVLYSEVAMKQEKVSRETQKDLAVIRDLAKRAGKLMRALLSYSRKEEPNMRKTDIHKVIDRVVEMLQYQMKVNNIILGTDFQTGTPNVNGDVTQLTQVFMNIIMNAGEAIKGADEGNIVVNSTHDSKWVKISITDDGVGIPRENIEQIFLPFFTTKDIGEGTGLGLSVCYGIISSHGGTIIAENNDGGGATFTMTLPVYKPRVY